MDNTHRAHILQRWNIIQYDLIPELNDEVGCLTSKLEKLIHVLEWVRIEEFVNHTWHGVGRPPHDRGALANAFVAKTVLNLSTTVGLIERLEMDRALRRICGFPMWQRLPDESTFSRAFTEFAQDRLAERVHEALIEQHLGNTLIGHISRDGTAIEAREKPAKQDRKVAEPDDKPVKRGRPKAAEVREPKLSPVAKQLTQTLPELLADLPKACDRGTKCNAAGYKNSWNGYKLHLDTADCGVPVSAILTSASTHDSRAAVPLALLTASRVTNLYDLMDAGYCSEELRAHSRSLGHVPLIDHNPRRGEKKQFEPHEAQRYHERTQAERANGRLKDEFGARFVRVQGAMKVMSHLMFGVLVLSVDQLMRLVT
ncbi:MAG: transposase [Burkholderiales bacterium]